MAGWGPWKGFLVVGRGPQGPVPPRWVRSMSPNFPSADPPSLCSSHTLTARPKCKTPEARRLQDPRLPSTRLGRAALEERGRAKPPGAGLASERWPPCGATWACGAASRPGSPEAEGPKDPHSGGLPLSLKPGQRPGQPGELGAGAGCFGPRPAPGVRAPRDTAVTSKGARAPGQGPRGLEAPRCSLPCPSLPRASSRLCTEAKASLSKTDNSLALPGIFQRIPVFS